VLRQFIGKDFLPYKEEEKPKDNKKKEEKAKEAKEGKKKE
jgi:hypothetical protein